MAETYQAPQGVTVWSADSIEQSSSARALLFESYQQRFAVTADYVTEVIEVPEYTTVPGAPGWYCGLAVYRARPVAVIDPIQFFVPDRQVVSHTRAIVVSVASSTYFFLAEKILNLAKLDPVHNNAHTNQDLAAHSAVSAVCHVDNKPVVLIDTPEFLRQMHLLRAVG